MLRSASSAALATPLQPPQTPSPAVVAPVRSQAAAAVPDALAAPRDRRDSNASNDTTAPRVAALETQRKQVIGRLEGLASTAVGAFGVGYGIARHSTGSGGEVIGSTTAGGVVAGSGATRYAEHVPADASLLRKTAHATLPAMAAGGGGLLGYAVGNAVSHGSALGSVIPLVGGAVHIALAINGHNLLVDKPPARVDDDIELANRPT